MGFIKAAAGAAGGVLADQWRDFFYCEALDEDTLMAKGEKRVDKRSSNAKGTDNIISDGSIVAIADGQCMIVVEQGAILDVVAEPGEYVYDTGTEPSIFYGSLGEGIVKSFQQMGKRFGFGGQPGQDQRIYFFNTKEIYGNKYGTASPVPFRVVDTNIGLDVDISVRCNGEYSYRLTDPILFYKNVAGNVEGEFTRDRIDSQLKSELLTALQPAFAKISGMGIRYSAIPAHTMELADALNEVLSEQWGSRRGIEIAEFGVNSITASEEDEQMIKDLQKAAVMRDPRMAAANIAAAQGDAMRDAANNESGAMNGFIGMGMAGAVGGMNAGSLFQQGQQGEGQVPPSDYPMDASGGFGTDVPDAGPKNTWTCECGASNIGKFCSECGKERPASAGVWTCECGASNAGKFCSECGKPRQHVTACAKCGWTPDAGIAPSKFCPDCGNPLD